MPRFLSRLPIDGYLLALIGMVILAALFLAFSAKSGAETQLIVPFFKSVAYPLGIIGFITLTGIAVPSRATRTS